MSRTGDAIICPLRELDYANYSSLAARMSYTKTKPDTDSHINNIEDPITYEPIHKDRAVLIHKQQQSLITGSLLQNKCYVIFMINLVFQNQKL